MRTLLITDFHLYGKLQGHLYAQTSCILDILDKKHDNFDEAIFMGDIFMRRHPSPSELVAFKTIATWFKTNSKILTILRGNHDSENKSDDGMTCLSVYVDDWVRVVRQTTYDDANKRVFIPHYEDDSFIVDDLALVPDGYTVFGHFGYSGCLNSVGDYDFGIDLKSFKNKTYLGHVHHWKQEGNVTILGTPYSTNYGEAGKGGYYAILDGDEVEFVRLRFGPRHVVMPMSELHDHSLWLNDPKWFTMLRVILEPGESMADIPDDLDVAHIEFKYKSTFDEEEQSCWRPDDTLFQLNSQILEDYVDGCDTSLSRGDIMLGYETIKKGDPLPDED